MGTIIITSVLPEKRMEPRVKLIPNHLSPELKFVAVEV
jgi:hypothetical protein